MRALSTSIVAFLVGLGLAAPAAWAAAPSSPATLGASGEVYLARTGTYGELFPGSPAAGVDPTDAVLALDVLKPGQPLERLLVPGTQGADNEELPALLFEESSNTLFLVWETRLDHLYPVLTLAAFNPDSGQFTDSIPVLGNPMAMKTSAQLAVTHDTYSLPGDTQVHHRSVIHMLWGEENGAGLYETFYTPIILEDGAFIGHNPIYRLNDLDTSTGTPAGPLPADLLHAQRIQAGRDGQTVVVGFVSPATGRVLGIEIDVLSAQLSVLADDARMHIIDIGRKLSYPAPARLQQLGDTVYQHLLDAGQAFYPEIVQTLAEQVRAQVVQPPPAGQGIEVLAGKARMHIIDIGAKYSGRGLKNAATTTTQVVEIAGSTPTVKPQTQAKPLTPLTHMIQFRVASSRVAPAVPAGTGPISLFAARSGQDLLVAWSAPNRALYRITNGDGWDDAREIRFSDNIDQPAAYDILDQKVKNR